MSAAADGGVSIDETPRELGQWQSEGVDAPPDYHPARLPDSGRSQAAMSQHKHSRPSQRKRSVACRHIHPAVA